MAHMQFLKNTIPVRTNGAVVMVAERLEADKRICIQAWAGRWRIFDKDGRFDPVTVDNLDDARMFAEAHA